MYTYYIKWTKQNTHYYGVRIANKTEPENDLWVEYFTSSKYVKEHREKFGEPDVVEIRKRFTNRQDALLWESRVLTKLKVKKKEKWLNRYDTSYHGAIGPKPKGFGDKVSKSLKGKSKSKEHCDKVSNTLKGKYTRVTDGKTNVSITQQELDEYLTNHPEWWRGYTTSDEVRAKMSDSAKLALRDGKRSMPENDHAAEKNPMYGKSHTSDTKIAISKKRKQYFEEHPEEKLTGKKNGMYGKKHTNENKRKASERSSKLKWYNDGIENKCIKDGDVIPTNFVRGRLVTWSTKKK